MPRATIFDVAKLDVLVGRQICQAWLYKSSDIFTIMQRPDTSSAHYKGFVRFQEKLCKKIKRLREEHGYTQEDMTDFELSLRQYQRMEQDPSTIVSLWQVYKLAKAFKVSVDDLLDVDK